MAKRERVLAIEMAEPFRAFALMERRAFTLAMSILNAIRPPTDPLINCTGSFEEHRDGWRVETTWCDPPSRKRASPVAATGEKEKL